ncbi:MAG: MFS transporter [Desulfopila sp.]
MPAKHRLASLLIAGGVFLSTMDSSMVNVALPGIMRAFQVSLAEVKLVVLVYLMVITLSLALWGRVGDALGKGNVYVAGLAIFALGALACAVSGTFFLLIGFRALQAAGAAMMMANGPAIVKLVSPRQHLGKTLGFIGIATSCGLMSGPLLSGIIISVVSWRGVFLVLVPLAVLIVMLGLKFMLPGLRSSESREHQPFDWSGGILWALFVGLFVLLTNGSVRPWYLYLLLVGALGMALLLFLKAERRAVAPILPLVLVRKRYYWTSVASAAISFAALFIVLILLPFYLDYILCYPIERIGLVMMALPVSLVVISPLSGWLYDRLGSARLIATSGLVLSGGAVLSMLQLDSASHFAEVFWRLTLLGAGQSIFLAPNSASVLIRVKDTSAGIASGILATARNFGMLTGTALAGTGFGLLYGHLAQGESILEYSAGRAEAFLLAQRLTLAMALLLLLGGCLISWSRGR